MQQVTTTDAAMRTPRSAQGVYVVGVLLVAWVLAYLDRQIMILLIPSLKADLALTDTQVSLVQGFAFSIFFALAGLPLGRWVDRSNRRNIIIFGLLTWSAMTILCGLADGFGELFLARVGVGAGEACLAPASFSLIADYFDSSRRGRAIGVVTAGAGLGGAASGAIGGILLGYFEGAGAGLIGDWSPWRAVLLAVGLPGLPVALLMLTVREPPRRESGSAGMGAVGFGQHVKARGRLFAMLFAGFVAHSLAGFSSAVWAPVVLMRKFGMPAAEVGLLTGAALLLATPPAALVGGALADWLVRRKPESGRLIAACVVCTPSSLFILLQMTPTASAVIAGYMGLLFCANAITTISYGVLHDLVPNEMRGQIIALYLLLLGMIGGGLGPTLTALITDRVLGDEGQLQYALAIVGVPAVLTCLPVLWAARGRYAKARADILAAIG